MEQSWLYMAFFTLNHKTALIGGPYAMNSEPETIINLIDLGNLGVIAPHKA